MPLYKQNREDSTVGISASEAGQHSSRLEANEFCTQFCCFALP